MTGQNFLFLQLLAPPTPLLLMGLFQPSLDMLLLEVTMAYFQGPRLAFQFTSTRNFEQDLKGGPKGPLRNALMRQDQY